MRRMLRSRYTRLVVWLLTITTTTLSLPVDAFAYPNPQERQRERAAKRRQSLEKALGRVKHRSDIRQLTSAEMSRILGRGYRNPYLCGTMPWHRSFRDVNLCTGNLFKSFTDVQVSPGRGAGLVLQRTYNSNDETEGPFGHGWTHAYDIKMQEISEVTDPDDPDLIDTAVRTDFFGGKHKLPGMPTASTPRHRTATTG